MSIWDNLTNPGLTLIFCDDTDISGQPNPALAPDLRILCGVEVPSERYAVVEAQITGLLATYGQSEFHATEIVNPNTASQWKQLAHDVRVEAFRRVAQLLTSSSSRVRYAFVSRGQYGQLRTEAEKLGHVGIAHKMGLKRVFLRRLIERLGSSVTDTAIIMDQDKPLPAPQVEDWPEGALLRGGGPIAASSATVPGLQLADMAVFSIGRFARRRQEIGAGSGNPFDQTAVETIAELGGRLECLINETVPNTLQAP